MRRAAGINQDQTIDSTSLSRLSRWYQRSSTRRGERARETHTIIKAAMRYYSRSSRDGDEQLIERTYGDFYAAVRTLIESRRD